MDSSSLSAPPPARPRRGWRRRLLIGLGVLVFLLLPVGLYLYLDYCGKAEIRAIVEKLDAEDPHWRLHEIEAKRAVIPDEENSALVVQAALKGLPMGWSKRTVYKGLDDAAPPFRLDPQVAVALQADLKLLEPQLTEARKLANLPRGRFAITWAPDLISTRMNHCMPVLQLADLLKMDALARADGGDFQGAWQSGQANLNAARSFGDEPTTMAVLVRIAVRRVALACLQRTLAQGELPELALAQTQKLLDDEVGQHLTLAMLRSERAWQHEIFLRIEAGELSPQALRDAAGNLLTVGAKLEDAFLPGTAKKAHAWSLRYLTQAVEVARLPAAERLAALHELLELASVRQPPTLALGVYYLIGQAESTILEQTRVDCARAALAAERFRLQQRRWPTNLAELVSAGLLSEVSTDPPDGQPLRFRRAADGVVVYSIGQDKKYRGDALDDIWNWNPKKLRVEFRLWNPDQRRQPPPLPRIEAGGGAKAPPRRE